MPDLADAIRNALTEHGNMSMVGGFSIQVEGVNPDNGAPELHLFHSTDLPYWTEVGMLRARLAELDGQQYAQEANDV